MVAEAMLGPGHGSAESMRTAVARAIEQKAGVAANKEREIGLDRDAPPNVNRTGACCAVH